MYGVELYSEVRMALLRDGVSPREAARRLGVGYKGALLTDLLPVFLSAPISKASLALESPAASDGSPPL